ncbi:MAG: IS200/IS605 family transposase [Spirochaetia bacterium]|nr:IS200/IS605 family transposase [Spirochaetia bacterium]
MLKKGRSYYHLDYHLIFSTRHRAPLINHNKLFIIRDICGQIADEMDFKIYILNGYLDHVHLLLTIPPKLAIANVVKIIKGRTSHALPDFYWQKGYGVFVVERESFRRIFAYIKDQENHHRNEGDYEDELNNLAS